MDDTSKNTRGLSRTQKWRKRKARLEFESKYPQLVNEMSLDMERARSLNEKTSQSKKQKGEASASSEQHHSGAPCEIHDTDTSNYRTEMFGFNAEISNNLTIVQSTDSEDSESQNGASSSSSYCSTTINDFSSTENDNFSDDSDCNNDDEHAKSKHAKTKIYPGARITVFESALLLVMYFLTFKVSYASMNMIIQIIILHLPRNNLVFRSMYLIKKFFAMDSLNKASHNFCVKCLVLVKGGECQNCGSTEFESFLIFDMNSQIKKLFERDSFVKNLTSRSLQPENSHSSPLLKHITDGALYKAMSKLCNKGMKSIYDISFLMYTDGMQIFNSSKLSVWPIIFTVNELPTSQRNLPHNVIFGGLWYSKIKPDFNLFMSPIADQFRKFYNEGLSVRLGNLKNIIINPILLALTADKPAKASVLNMKSQNGRSSCPKCEIVGKSVPHKVKNKMRNKFCFEHSGKLKPRSHARSIQHSRQGTKAKPCKGYKGANIFSTIVPDFISGIGEDVMHTIFGGIGGKKMIELWVHETNKNQPYSLYNKVDLISERIKNVRPPIFIRRRLRTLDQSAYYKTSEYKNWFLYYSIPILHDLMDEVNFKHYFKLVHAIYLLNLEGISPSQIKLASNLLQKYIDEYGSIYGNHLKIPNFHSLNHLIEAVQALGPLYETSCFPLESLLGFIKKFILGPNSPAIKISDMFSLLQNVRKATDHLPETSPVHNLVKSMQHGSRASIDIGEGNAIVGKLKAARTITPISCIALKDSHLIMLNCSSKVTKVWTFNIFKNTRCEVVGFIDKSTIYDSSLIYTKNEKIFRVQSFIRYKLCDCDMNCDCKYYHFAIGFYCDIMQNAKIPTNPFINQIYINEQSPTSICVSDIVDSCALIPVLSENRLLYFGCKRLNSVEKE